MVDMDMHGAACSAMPSRSSKSAFLRAARAWNERARLVESDAFAQSDFFDPRDKVQVKYEMLRAHHVDGVSVSQASRRFGYSRESFYAAVDDFRSEGVLGLVDAKRGPKHARKLTPDVQRRLTKEMERNPSISTADLVALIEKDLDVSIHRRSIERFRSTRGKKNATRRTKS